ncbi:DRTGG domain-containing protein [Caldibacillus lycopersici]|uniref:DRTGG domain-containing protein n=1 Tax=Perspicuibacillus lycopersici TaxID=1325689 RepID=A0AAE3LN25_9BACI|nr:DRTGG domain-containing protein [Perspicuibacillus lycopersici]MCU9614200.1 DRTGG domain-containing protein [Perspicuibacillus lycopersici]
MATKHEQILNYIGELPIGSKISVRQIAKALGVSEGTAYRAIKDAENKGYVSTIERVGTIRIELKRKENIEKLTYAEVVNIVDGQVLGGKNGLHKTLNKFVIGAMELDAMMRYTEAGNLLIIGNRINAQKHALNTGAAVLITGGFDTEDDVKRLADKLELPIISTSYDTFTVATLINRAIFDQLIKKEILLVEDILIPRNETYYLTTNDKVESWFELNKQSGHSRFPVIDQNFKLEGIVTSKDVLNQEDNRPIEKIMTKNIISVTSTTSVASASHMMIWEGIELLPVVDEQYRLMGIISRQDVLKALQTNQRQPHVGETIDNIISNNIHVDEEKQVENKLYTFDVTPQMTNHHGTLSYGVFTSLIIESANRAFRSVKKGELIVENITIYFFKPVQIDHTISIIPKILEIGRKFGKVDIEVFNEGSIAGKAMMMFQFIDR